ncbi:MAG TPA: hypothetical protein VKF42_00545 [Chitinivibrionales bacterium]|jgi:phosphopantetheinyl transferase (holo-ACP synthase)|nr:hypothetical protein [Chitinivibrionales bacterium]
MVDRKSAGTRIRNAVRHEPVRVLSFLEIVPLAYVKKSKTQQIRMSFPSKEVSRLSAFPLRTVAGMIAVKKAVATLAAAVYGVRMSLREISLTHSSIGIPRLLPLSPRVRSRIPAWQSIQISISHTATHAFGLAAISVKESVHG